jgi:hypothetical protein
MRLPEQLNIALSRVAYLKSYAARPVGRTAHAAM